MKPKFLIRHNTYSFNPYNLFLLTFMIVVMFANSCGPPPPPSRSTQTVSTPVEEETIEVIENTGEMDAAYFLTELTNLKRLAAYHPGESVVTYSSHNPNDEGNDYGNFIEKIEENGKEWNVLLDVEGPGVITRMFFNNDITGTIKIYFDHQAEPAIETTFQDLIKLNQEIFELYIAYDPERSGNGFSSYFPMPFTDHCTIITDSETEELKYQFDIRKFPKETPLKTFSGKLDDRTKTALKNYNDTIVKNAVGKYQDTILKGFTDHVIEAGTTKLVANDTGPAAIEFFAIDINPVDLNILSSVVIKMFWDDMKEPAVNTPLREFFAANVGLRDTWNSLPIGHYPKTDSFPRGFFYCQFYMPFQKKAQILFENTGDQDVTVRFLRKLDFSELQENSLHFFAQRDQRELPLGLIFPVFEMEGKGNFVGLNQLIVSRTELDPPNFALEGDPYIYIDGEENPSIAGTGMDNYFNTHSLLKYYTPFWLPTHGCLYSSQENPSFSHTYRFHFLDSVPFNTSIFMMQEIGDPSIVAQTKQEGQTLVNYQWTCYWYGETTSIPVVRKEEAFYYAFNRAPTPDDPIMKGYRLHLQLPAGEWNMQYAPVWDLSQIDRQTYQVQ